MPLDSDTFRAVLGHFASGVTVLTTVSDGRDLGMTVNAFSSLSLAPPLVLACIDRDADLHDLLPTGKRVVFSILSSGQEELSRRFSEEEGSRRFDGVGFHRSRHGIAVLDEVLASIEGAIVGRHAGGDHSVFIAQVDHATTDDRRPLLFYRGGYTVPES